MQIEIKVIEENEVLDDELEMLDVSAMMFIEDQNVVEENRKPNIIQTKASTFNEPVDFNSTLAEMSIIEGNELLASGSYEMAIERFREAVKYNPTSKIYQTKLLEATERAKSKNSPAKSATSRLSGRLDSALALSTQTAKASSLPSLKDTQAIDLKTTNSSREEIKQTEEIFTSHPLKDTQEVSINETLAEMSFIEAMDLLSRGDQLVALERIRQAIKYAPNNPSYTNKLNSILSESKPNKTAALKPLKEEIFKESILETKLEENSSKSSNKKSSSGSTKIAAKLEALDTQGPLAVTISSKPKTSRNTFLFAIATMILVFIIALVYQSKSVSLTTVKLSYPSDQAKLNKQQLEFEWHSTGDRFLIEIESVGRPVVKAYAQETRYKLTPNQVSSININTNYKWKVTPVDFKGEPIPHKTEEKWFEVVK